MRYLITTFCMSIFSGSVFCIQIAHLKTDDHQSTSIGFDNPTPEFSWILQSEERGAVQTAYEIWVSDDQKMSDAGNCWQSGKIPGNKTFVIRYAGKPLKLFTAIYRSQRDHKWIKFPLLPETGKKDMDGRKTETC
jgi:alpha-L-rhamnosidase